jgi:hypothetical protein
VAHSGQVSIMTVESDVPKLFPFEVADFGLYVQKPD